MSLTHHRLGVDLTHVPAAVRRAYLLEGQGPGSVSVADADAVIFRDDVAGNRQDCLSVHPEPRHLDIEIYDKHRIDLIV